jgi:hypothetical protein
MLRTRIAIAVSLLAVPTLARATNTRHERTPVLWPQAPCMTLVDRTQDAVLQLDYDIPFEDTMVTVDEVAGSRTHQFFAICRDQIPLPVEPMPNWIDQSDVDAADAVGLDVGMVGSPDVLDRSDDWAGCFVRITADDARRPITAAAAADAVEWDTSDADAGGYVLLGYTYEPLKNHWWPRPGVVKLHDGDPDAVGPVAAIEGHTEDFSVYRDESIMLGGCVDALAGTSFDVEVRRADGGEWSRYADDLAIDGDAFELELTPPAELAGELALVRVVFEDPMARSWTAYLPVQLVVIDAPNPATCADDGGFIGTMCGSSSDGGTDATSGSATGGSSSSATAESSSGTPSEQPHGDGCGCAAEPMRSAVVLLLLPVLGRRRRSSRPQRRA